MWDDLKLPSNLSKELDIETIGELRKLGCPLCTSLLYAEGSPGGFGSLHCVVHGIIWMFGLLANDRLIPYRKYAASKFWKNYVTGKVSKEWFKKYGGS